MAVHNTYILLNTLDIQLSIQDQKYETKHTLQKPTKEAKYARL